jgi:hypothetical protein
MASLWRAYQACFAASTNEVFRLFWYCRINTNTYIDVKYKIHLYSLRNRPEKLAEGSLLFLKLVQINITFTDNVRILYIYIYIYIKPLIFLCHASFCRSLWYICYIVSLECTTSKSFKFVDSNFLSLSKLFMWVDM